MIFDKFLIDLPYEANKKVSNIARGGSSTGALTYSIDNTNVATIDANTGELTIKGVGIAIITATKAGDANHHAIASNYILRVSKIDQTGFGFTQESITIVHTADATTSNIAIGGQGRGVVSYSIDNTNVATVNSTNGELTIKGAGTAIITATKAGDAHYNAVAKSYILKVNAKPSIKFEFEKSAITVKYTPGLTATNTISVKNVATGQIRYESDTTSVATVNGDGSLSIQGAGTATITATLKVLGNADSSNTKEYTATFLLTVLKGDQAALIFDESELSVGLENGKASNIARGGSGDGAITYSIDNTNVATINSTSGELTLTKVQA